MRVARRAASLGKRGSISRRTNPVKRRAPVKFGIKQSARGQGLWRKFVARKSARSWRAGADGEEEVARSLDKLPDGWCILHAVPVGETGSDIDHVIIGPGGVFTLNTKNHSGGKVWVAHNTFMVNGQKKDYLRNSRHEAKRATKLLSAACTFNVPVTPVIVVMAQSLTVKAKPEGVEVVGRKQIAKWLSRRPPALTPETVDWIYAQ